MKKSILILALASLAIGQTSKTATAGASYAINRNVTFGGNNFLTFTSATDTLSDPFLAEISLIRPGTFVGIEYKAIAVDSNNVNFQLSFQSRTCQDAVNGTGCPTQWMTPRYRLFQNNLHFADTLRVSQLPTDTAQVGQYTLIPTGNQMRIRIKGTGTSSVYINNIKVVGY